MKNLKEDYYFRANNLMSRLLGEAPEDEEANPPESNPEDETNSPEVEGEPEEGQAEQVDIFFDNLDEKTQKVLMDALKENLNITTGDEFSHSKLVDELSKKPIVSLRAEELVRKLNLDV